MRVLYVIDSLAPGGAETSLAELAPGMIECGVELHVLPLGKAQDLAPRLEDAGAVLHEPTNRGGRVANVRSVLATIREIKPDLVHTTLYEADVAGRVAARIARVPSSTSLVNDSYGVSHREEAPAVRLAAAYALDRVTAASARRFHAISAAIAESLGPRLGLSPDRIDVVPRGRDPQRFPFRPVEVRQRTRRALGLDDVAPVVLAVGRQEPQKGLQHLLRAAPIVASEHPNLVVLIAGREGRATEELRATTAGSGIVDIRFLGQRTDVADLLSAADVFCFPSEREGFGGVLIEALAVGCPIVGSAIPTTREVLGSGSPVGWLSPVGDVGALAADINTVLGDRESATEVAVRGRRRFDQHFTVDSVAVQMAGFFARVAGPQPSRWNGMRIRHAGGTRSVISGLLETLARPTIKRDAPDNSVSKLPVGGESSDENCAQC